MARQLVMAAVACFLMAGVLAATPTGQLPKIDNFNELGLTQDEQNLPIVILVEQTGCRYCKRLNREYLYPMHRSKRFEGRVLFRRISIDAGETIIGLDNMRVATTEFCSDYQAEFTPTVLFVDFEGRQLHENLLGYSSPDYYGYDLEKAIDHSYKTIHQQD